MKKLMLAAAVCLMAAAAAAEPTRERSNLPVAQAVENLKAAIERAGAQVFAVIDFQQGAESVGVTLRPTVKVIFGNPQIGSAALAESQTMGMFVPLQMLIWEDDAGAVWLMTPDPEAAAAEHGLDPDHEAIQKMKAAMAAMRAAAAG